MTGLALALAILVRWWPRLRHPGALQADTQFHLHCAAAIHAAGLRLPAELPRLAFNPTFDYPFLYAWLLALAPERWRTRLEGATGAVFDAALLAVAWAWCAWLNARSLADVESAPVVALLALAPAMLRPGSGPRAYSGTPRVLGELLHFAHLVLAHVAWVDRSGPALVGSLLAGAALVVTSKFASQALVFFGVVLAAAVTPWYAALATACVATALMVTGGRAWSVIVGQVQHSRFYRLHLQDRYVWPTRRTTGAWLRDLGGALGALGRGRPGPLAVWLLTERHPGHLLLFVHPHLALALAHPWLVGGASGPLVAWSGASFAWFALTKLRPLYFLGEGERYLEFGLVPALVLAVEAAGRLHPGLVPGYLAWSALCAAGVLRLVVRQCREAEEAVAGARPALERLAALPPGRVLPLGHFHWLVVRHGGQSVVTPGGNIDLRRVSLDDVLLLWEHIPLPGPRLEELLRRFDITYVVTDAPSLARYRALLPDPAVIEATLEPVPTEGALLLYRVRR